MIVRIKTEEEKLVEKADWHKCWAWLPKRIVKDDGTTVLVWLSSYYCRYEFTHQYFGGMTRNKSILKTTKISKLEEEAFLRKLSQDDESKIEDSKRNVKEYIKFCNMSFEQRYVEGHRLLQGRRPPAPSPMRIKGPPPPPPPPTRILR